MDNRLDFGFPSFKPFQKLMARNQIAEFFTDKVFPFVRLLQIIDKHKIGNPKIVQMANDAGSDHSCRTCYNNKWTPLHKAFDVNK